MTDLTKQLISVLSAGHTLAAEPHFARNQLYFLTEHTRINYLYCLDTETDIITNIKAGIVDHEIDPAVNNQNVPGPFAISLKDYGYVVINYDNPTVYRLRLNGTVVLETLPMGDWQAILRFHAKGYYREFLGANASVVHINSGEARFESVDVVMTDTGIKVISQYANLKCNVSNKLNATLIHCYNREDYSFFVAKTQQDTELRNQGICFVVRKSGISKLPVECIDFAVNATGVVFIRKGKEPGDYRSTYLTHETIDRAAAGDSKLLKRYVKSRAMITRYWGTGEYFDFSGDSPVRYGGIKAGGVFATIEDHVLEKLTLAQMESHATFIKLKDGKTFNLVENVKS